MSTTADKKRPGADGHRFGPDLLCSECGISWELHQDEPQPCERPAPLDAGESPPRIADAVEAVEEEEAESASTSAERDRD